MATTQGLAAQAERQDPLLLGEGAGQEIDGLGLDLLLGERHVAHAGLAGQDARDLAFRTDAQALQDRPQLLAGLLLLLQRLLELILADPSGLDEDLTDLLGPRRDHVRYCWFEPRMMWPMSSPPSCSLNWLSTKGVSNSSLGPAERTMTLCRSMLATSLRP